jgi:hypothetical protein
VVQVTPRPIISESQEFKGESAHKFTRDYHLSCRNSLQKRVPKTLLERTGVRVLQVTRKFLVL